MILPIRQTRNQEIKVRYLQLKSAKTTRCHHCQDYSGSISGRGIRGKERSMVQSIYHISSITYKGRYNGIWLAYLGERGGQEPSGDVFCLVVGSGVRLEVSVGGL